MLSLLRTLYSRIQFCSPQRSHLLVFDRTNIGALVQTVLRNDIEHTVLPTRQEVFYISLPILFLMMKNLRYFGGMTTGIRSVIGQLQRIYLLSCVEYIHPKIVLTFIDNSFSYQWISRQYNGPRYYAVQNGSRSKGDVLEWLPSPPHPAGTISMPDFFCFGRYEMYLYKEHHHTIDRFHPVGSLLGGYYRSQAGIYPNNMYELSLISQWGTYIEAGRDPEMIRALDILNQYLVAYAREYMLPIHIALRSIDATSMSREKEYFQRVYGEHAKFIEQDRAALSTYHSMDQSHVIITVDSTAAVEAFGWGKKVLFCDFSGSEIHNYFHATSQRFPETEKFCFIQQEEYPVFVERLHHLREIGQAEFEKMTAECRKFFMQYDDENPAHEVIRQQILSDLSNVNISKEKHILLD